MNPNIKSVGINRLKEVSLSVKNKTLSLISQIPWNKLNQPIFKKIGKYYLYSYLATLPFSMTWNYMTQQAVENNHHMKNDKKVAVLSSDMTVWWEKIILTVLQPHLGFPGWDASKVHKTFLSKPIMQSMNSLGYKVHWIDEYSLKRQELKRTLDQLSIFNWATTDLSSAFKEIRAKESADGVILIGHGSKKIWGDHIFEPEKNPLALDKYRSRDYLYTKISQPNRRLKFYLKLTCHGESKLEWGSQPLTLNQDLILYVMKNSHKYRFHSDFPIQPKGSTLYGIKLKEPMTAMDRDILKSLLPHWSDKENIDYLYQDSNASEKTSFDDLPAQHNLHYDGIVLPTTIFMDARNQFKKAVEASGHPHKTLADLINEPKKDFDYFEKEVLNEARKDLAELISLQEKLKRDLTHHYFQEPFDKVYFAYQQIRALNLIIQNNPGLDTANYIELKKELQKNAGEIIQSHFIKNNIDLLPLAPSNNYSIIDLMVKDHPALIGVIKRAMNEKVNSYRRTFYGSRFANGLQKEYDILTKRYHWF
jgi:hypothetical protein